MNAAYFLHGLSAGSTYNALITSTKHFDAEYPKQSYEGRFAATFLAASCASYVVASWMENELTCGRMDNNSTDAERSGDEILNSIRRVEIESTVRLTTTPGSDKFALVTEALFYLINILIYISLCLEFFTIDFGVMFALVAVMGASSALFQRACFREAASCEGSGAILAFNSGFAASATLISILSFADYPRTNFVFTAAALSVSVIYAMTRRWVRSDYKAFAVGARSRARGRRAGSEEVRSIEEGEEEEEEEDARGEAQRREDTSLEMRLLPFLIIVVILVGTLSVFPNLIVKLRPTSLIERSDKDDFTSSLFLFFNLGDFGGRLLSPLAVRDGVVTRDRPRLLCAMAAARTLALSALFATTREPRGGKSREETTTATAASLIDSAGAVQAIVLMHGLGNGFCYSTACAFAATSGAWGENVAEKRRVGSYVGLVTLISLAVGAVVGSFVS